MNVTYDGEGFDSLSPKTRELVIAALRSKRVSPSISVFATDVKTNDGQERAIFVAGQICHNVEVANSALEAANHGYSTCMFEWEASKRRSERARKAARKGAAKRRREAASKASR